MASEDNGERKSCKKCGHTYHDYERQCPHCDHRGILAGINGGIVFGAVAAVLVAIPLVMYGSLPDPSLADSSENGTGDIEYYYEDKTDVLLDRGAFLSGGDSITFDIQVPDKNVTAMDGRILVEGRNYLDVEFQDRFGDLYCIDCKFRVFGDQSGNKVSNIHGAVRIGVTKGDLMKLSITSPDDAWLQTVNITLQVSYLEQRERMVTH